MKKNLKLFILLVLVLVLVLFIKSIMTGFSSSQTFPALESKTYLGSVGAIREASFSGGRFLLEKVEEQEAIVFTMLEPDAQPRFIPLRKTESVKEQKTSYQLTSSLLPHPHDCDLSGEIVKGEFKGSLKCKKGGRASFIAKPVAISLFSGSTSNSIKDKEESSISPLLMELEHFERTRVSLEREKNELLRDEKALNALIALQEGGEELDTLLKGLREKLNILSRKEEELSKKKGLLQSEREQFFRVSERGNEVELARRLSRMEGGFLSKTWGLLGLDSSEMKSDSSIADSSMRLPAGDGSSDFLNQRELVSPSELESSGEELKEQEVKPQNSGQGEWWKQLE